DWNFGFAGFVNGPNILKKVLIPKARRIGATVFIAGWKRGACREQIFASSNCFCNVSLSLVNWLPRCSITFEEPQPYDTPTLPCLSTLYTAPSTTNDDKVNILIVS